MNLLKSRKFVTADQLAGLLGISKRQIWLLRAQGQLPPPQKKVPKSSPYLFKRAMWNTDELRQWLAQGCPPVGAAADGKAAGKKTHRAPVLKPDTLKKVSLRLLKSGKYLNSDEMAIFLGVSKRSLWRFKLAGRIPAPVITRKSGTSKAMWSTAQLRRWVAKGCPSSDTIEFAHKNPVRAKMLTYKHRQQRISMMKSRIVKKTGI